MISYLTRIQIFREGGFIFIYYLFIFYISILLFIIIYLIFNYFNNL